MFDNDYNLGKTLKKIADDDSKAKTIGPPFKSSTFFDNNTGKDWVKPL